MNIIDDALRFYLSGMTPLPAIATPEEKRPTLPSYKEYQTQRPTLNQVESWFAQADAICLLTGKASGNLELIDFDFEAMSFDAWCASVPAELLSRVVIETSINGGKHVVYQCQSPIDGNLKLARRKIQFDSADQKVIARKKVVPRKNKDGSFSAVITLIETRGEGGLFLCSPTPGYTITQGDLANPPIITAAERNLLLDAARALNECDNSHDPKQADISSSGDSTIPTSHPFEPQGATSGILPGDDYIARGDVPALLAKHGWRNVGSKPDGNTLWRRPGKESGHSASLKDSIFFVFSSNATPLEADRAYNPFQLYAALEHEDDYKAAASALRADGFGRDADNSDVDISGILSSVSEPSEPPTSSPADPGPMPDELLHIPGFIKQVMDFTLNTAPYPNTTMAFCGALSLLAFFAGRKVRDNGDNRTNLYLLGLAHSASGKDWPRKINTRIVYELGLASCLGERFASGEGIQDALFRTPCMLFQTDEIDGLLQSINKSKDARHEMIMNTLLTMYSSASMVVPMRRKAGKESPGVINQPSLVIFGTAIPNHYYEALSERMLTNGLFARMIILESGPRGTGQEPLIRAIPQQILDTAKWWTDYRPGTGNLENWNPVPTVIEHSDEAKQFLVHSRTLAETEYTAAEAKKDPVGTTVWGRVSENIRKLALLYAISENHLTPLIGINAVQWASEFVMHQTKRMLFMAAGHVAENPFHAECLKAIEKLRNEPGNVLSHSILLKRMKMDAKNFAVLIETLVQQGEVESITTPRAGTYQRAYRLNLRVKCASENRSGGET